MTDARPIGGCRGPRRPPAPRERLQIVQESGHVGGLVHAKREGVAQQRAVLVRPLRTHADLRHDAEEDVAEVDAGGVEAARVGRCTLGPLARRV